jgi:glycosyltransferase involved in cell wall biosynthesis
MESVKVSVIIPNYNHAPFLDQRISSVLNQTYQDIEIILLDDASVDDSKNIIEKYRKNSKISIIDYNLINSGSTFKQWKKGIKLASGDFIWIAESDDYCEPTFLEELIFLINKTNSSIAFSQSLAFRENEILFTSSSPQLYRVYSGEFFVQNKLIENNTLFNASMVIFKKSLVEASDFKSVLKYSYCGDWLFWILIIYKATICESGKVLNYFRKHDNDVTSSSKLNGKALIEYRDIQKYLYEKKYINFFSYNKHLYFKINQFKSELYPTRENVNAFNIVLQEIPKYYRVYFNIKISYSKIKNLILFWR